MASRSPPQPTVRSGAAPAGGGRPSASIRSRLLRLVGVVIAPIAVLFAFHGARDVERAETTAEIRALGVASEAAAGIQQFYDLSRRSVARLADEFGARLLERSSCLDAVTPAYAAVPAFANLVVFDAAGDLVCGGVETGRTINVADRDWMQALGGQDFAVGEPALGRIIETWVVALAAAIRVDGELRGAVAGTIELRRFQEIIGSLDLPEEGLLTVTTRGNVVMARSRDPEAWIGRLLPTSPSAVSIMNATRAVTRANDADGTPRIFGRIDLPGPGWRVFVGIPEAVAFAEARTALSRELLLMVLLVGVTFVSAIAIQRGISRNLESLAAGVRGVAEGHPVALPPSAPPEVALVATQVNRAIDERLRAEEAEARVRAHLDALIDNAVFGIVVTSREGTVLRANRAYAEMLGYDSVEEVLALAAPLDALLARHPTGSVLRNEEARLRARDGSERLVRINGRVDPGPDGDDVFELIVEDVTKERALEEMTRHQQKMDAVGRLAGGVAHEFNNLLTVMGVNAEFLREAIAPFSDARGEVDEIGTAVDRAKTLTRKLLAFSRKEIVQPTLVDLSKAVAEFQGMLRKVIPEHVRIDIDLAEDVGPVHIDVLQVEQALLNLVINARDAMPGGGRVHIRTDRHVGPGPEVAAESNGEGAIRAWALLRVEDDGPGIAEDIRSLVFEPFFTTKPAGQGTGLGLPTVYGIVSEAGGHVTIETARGGGAVVTLWFPISGV